MRDNICVLCGREGHRSSHCPNRKVIPLLTNEFCPRIIDELPAHNSSDKNAPDQEGERDMTDPIRAALTDYNMPEPTLLRRVLPDHYWYGDVYGYTADQLRSALSAQAERHAVVVNKCNSYIVDNARLAEANDALRAEVEALRAALKPFADADLTLPTVRDTFGFDVLRARAALAQPAEPAALTDEQVWLSEEIMSINARAGLTMPVLMELVRAIERAIRSKT